MHITMELTGIVGKEQCEVFMQGRISRRLHNRIVCTRGKEMHLKDRDLIAVLSASFLTSVVAAAQAAGEPEADVAPLRRTLAWLEGDPDRDVTYTASW
jgi:hypothetical protein